MVVHAVTPHRTYIGDQVHKSIRIFARLEQSTGLKDDTMVLSVFAQKIVDSLTYWVRRFECALLPQSLISPQQQDYRGSPQAAQRPLHELQLHSQVRMLCSTSIIVDSWLDRLVGIDAIQFILQHHHEFQFLNAVEDTKHRTTFYSVCFDML
jgi:hypothetical protein